MISLWLLQFEIWIIIGIIFILLELTDGSTIFFLPLGIGSLILSFYIYLSNIGIINQNIIIDTWYIFSQQSYLFRATNELKVGPFINWAF